MLDIRGQTARGGIWRCPPNQVRFPAARHIRPLDSGGSHGRGAHARVRGDDPPCDPDGPADTGILSLGSQSVYSRFETTPPQGCRIRAHRTRCPNLLPEGAQHG